MQDKRMQEEQRFLLNLEKLKQDARRNGAKATTAQIRETFSGEDLSEEKLRQIIAYLAAQGIRTEDAGNLGTPAEEPGLPEEPQAGEDFLSEYEREIAAIEIPSENILTAVKISAMAGEKEAQRKLAEYMLPKVIDIAKLYEGQDVPIEDLIGTGNEALMQGVGLLMALESPDEVEGDLGARIMRAMESAVSENLEARAASLKIADEVNLVADKARLLAEDLGRRVTLSELVQEGELTPEQVLDAWKFSGGRIEDLEDPEKRA